MEWIGIEILNIILQNYCKTISKLKRKKIHRLTNHTKLDMEEKQHRIKPACRCRKNSSLSQEYLCC